MPPYITINLPDAYHEKLRRIANTAGARIDDHATDLLIESLDGTEPANARAATYDRGEAVLSAKSEPAAKELQSSSFRCAGKFPGASENSLNWAQRFTDASMAYNPTRIFKNGAGVGFDPNFVFIERIYTRDEGFIASFYGPPSAFPNFSLKNGRYGWSRLAVRSTRDLEIALKCMPIAARNKGVRRS